MKFSTVLSAALLGASTTLAAPRPAANRIGKRSIQKKSLPKMSAVGAHNTTADEEESYNWSGAVLVGTGYTSVTGKIVVPTISSGSSNNDKVGTAWVGIDGDTCSSLWQTGVSWTVEDGSVDYTAWYEWVPYSASVDFTGITISAGDSIVMTVTATSTTSGTATIENETTGKTVSHTYSSMSSDNALCYYNAEWIVEDFAECLDSSCTQTELLPFADYGSVEFTDCSAVKSGATVDVTGATTIDMVSQSDDSVESSCTDTASTVTCKYV
ncbi:proteinase aspergillopepsin [Grosmannia clavigera kw1407]|uniref:Proteinase aspergillopepsin n=1 Tax=Grosmannia clavigera (strain kw1407 / UAMH 11150) TaxID=655863 RepID=F0XQM7_GROCL|nr:proteinase aspergillopepsin [Grosmannia clavigera kw1407]EFW99951.1 proteinase aspergillopepsin [Grosmannia clavigera kw1407]